jgi:hypothetical protein
MVETVLKFLIKINMQLTYNPAKWTLVHCSRRINFYFYTNTRMFITALFKSSEKNPWKTADTLQQVND